jgi:hypothetical protein
MCRDKDKESIGAEFYTIEYTEATDFSHQTTITSTKEALNTFVLRRLPEMDFFRQD